MGAFSALNAHPVLVLELTGAAASNFIHQCMAGPGSGNGG